MSIETKPIKKPNNPNFSSGPCSKRPGYDPSRLDLSTLGRSHRSSVGKTALQAACEETKRLLHVPDDYRVGIVPASDTGAFEMAMWSMLGARGVDVFAWESFGSSWLSDILHELKLTDVNRYESDYGVLPDLHQANPDRDLVFTWNGTTSGVRVPDGDWIAEDREGLTLCDATSAVFAMDMPWEKLDVTTFSWQKVLGGEGAHGMLILSPRAVARLESYTPAWPMPKIFKLVKKNALIEGIFKGETINTPSMLCVADYLDALAWVDSIDGLSGAIARSQASLRVITDAVAQWPWLHFLAQDPSTISNTSVCLSVDATPEQVTQLAKLLEREQVAYDIGAYRDAPPGLRIWCGATVEPSDVAALMEWLEWGYHHVTTSH
ncbi:MAG: phosphoserine transaminase [Litorivicinaceae bacterium]|nr:phosphoserine transaminase [Litorivicinaceae bacterium]MDP5331104.1 phosphoserine transaminase [Litorivicinaceae bacterium]